MAILLTGKTSAEFWLRVKDRSSFKESVSEFSWAVPQSNDIRYLQQHYLSLTQPYHCMILKRTAACSLEQVKLHVSTRNFSRGSILKINDHLGVVCPELSFIQVAYEMPALAAIEYGTSLCSQFALDNSEKSGIVFRKPLTTISKIEHYLQTNHSLYGAPNARCYLAHIIELTASPAEVKLAMRLSLPIRMGGFGLPKPRANYVINLGQKAQEIAQRGYLKGDLCWHDAKVNIEYDSNSEHLTPAQITKDATKRSALMASGYHVETVTASQLRSVQSMEHIAKIIAKRLNVKIRFQSSYCRERQQELFYAPSAWFTNYADFDFYDRYPEFR